VIWHDLVRSLGEFLIMLMQGSRIPQVLVPWLALVLILVCLFVLIRVGRDMMRNGVSVMHVTLFLPTLLTILALGFGSTAVVTVMEGVRAAQNTAIAAGEKAENAQIAAGEKAESAQKAEGSTRSLLLSVGSFADPAAFTRSMNVAQNEEDRKLAFLMHAHENPELAQTWLSNPQNRNLFAESVDIEALQRQLEPVIAAQQDQLPANMPRDK